MCQAAEEAALMKAMPEWYAAAVTDPCRNVTDVSRFARRHPSGL
jgi:hypothetical protein